ncbi:L-cystine transporter, partial [Photobacterium damselae subsp. damselae]|nr:L-cystine transporter [Photobacterium damselae subsp. damselae]
MIYPIVNLIIFALLIALLYQQQRAEKTLSRRVFISLGLGVIFGACLQFVYGSGSEAINQTLNYVNI